MLCSVSGQTRGKLSPGLSSVDTRPVCHHACFWLFAVYRCKFYHPHPSEVPPPVLNSRGYPIRTQGEPDCAHFLKKVRLPQRCAHKPDQGSGRSRAQAIAHSQLVLCKRPTGICVITSCTQGWCAFGMTCKFNHPEIVSGPNLAIAAAQPASMLVTSAPVGNQKGRQASSRASDQISGWACIDLSLWHLTVDDSDIAHRTDHTSCLYVRCLAGTASESRSVHRVRGPDIRSSRTDKPAIRTNCLLRARIYR